MRSYRAFGLNLRSRLPLPELLPGGDRSADVEIVVRDVPGTLPDAVHSGVRYQAAPGRLLLHVDGIARYLIEDGTRIAVQADEGADESAVRLFLLGSALGALLHQRGDLVLHGSAIVVDGKAIGFLGRSGIGKSTLAMEFRRRGRSVLTDDLCVVRPRQDGVLVAEPGFPQSKLWLDSLHQLDLVPDGLRKIRAALEKRALPLAEGFAARGQPLERLYVLQPRPEEEITLEPLEGALKFELLRQNTYRMRFVGGTGRRAAHLGHGAALARQARITLVQRPAHRFRLRELADRIEADW